MFKTGDFVVYRRNVCQITDIMKEHIGTRDYYKLVPIDDATLNIDVPVDNKFIRPIISKEEAINFIAKIPDINPIDMDNKYIESDYKELINSGSHEDLIRIIKTTYLRNDARIIKGKKTTEKDDNYFKMAEKLLYNEFAIALNLSFDETKKYIYDEVSKLVK